MKNNNKGMSLIEIIIVIVLLSVVAGASVAGISYLRYGNTKKSAYEINAMIDKVRLQAMSKTDRPALYIYKVGEVYYMKTIGNDVVDVAAAMDNTGTVIANQQIRIFYKTTVDCTVETELGAGTPAYIKLAFAKDSGGIVKLDGFSTDNYYKELIIQDRDGGNRYTITLVSATGKHTIAKE